MLRNSLIGMIVVAVTILLGACGDSDTAASDTAASERPADSTEATDASTPPVSATSPPAPAVDLASLGLTALTECSTPWLPVFVREGSYPEQPPATEVRPEEGERIDLSARAYQPPDTDGDGTPDSITNGDDGNQVVFTRGDGAIELARDGGVVGSPGGQLWIGDLDGDGRDEIIVFATGDDRDLDPQLLLVVSGSTPAGRHDPVDVGVVLPIPVGALLGGVGDQNADGSDDLIIGADAGTATIDGAAVLEPGPGGQLEEFPAPISTQPEGAIGALQLTADGPPVQVTAEWIDSGVAELTLLTEPPVTLRTDRLAVPSAGDMIQGHLGGFRSGADRIVSYGIPVNRSGQSYEWLWNLDDACAGPTPPS